MVILQILLILFGIILAGVFAFFICPMVASVHFVYAEGKSELNASAHFIHCRIFRVDYSYIGKNIRLFIFGKQLFNSGNDNMANEPPGNTSEQPNDNSHDIHIDSSIPFSGNATNDMRPGESTINEHTEMPAGKYSPGNNASPENTPEGDFNEVKSGLAGSDENIGQGDKEQKHESIGQRLKKSKIFFLARQKIVISRILMCITSTISASLRIISFDACILRVKAGASDPVAPALAYGIISGAKGAGVLQNRGRFQVEFEPDFNHNELLEMSADIRCHTAAWRMVAPLFVFLITFPYVKVFILWRNMKKQGKL